MPAAPDFAVPFDPAQMLRAADLRVTRPRIAVLTALHAHPHSDTDTVIGSSERHRFVLNEQVIVHGLFGLPHEWKQPRGGEPDRKSAHPATASIEAA